MAREPQEMHRAPVLAARGRRTRPFVHTRRRTWAFRYDGADDDEDEPIFKFDRHRMVEGEYVTITEHDGVARTFRVVSLR